MCTTCGCSDNAKATVTDLDSGKVISMDEHGHIHDHNHSHDHDHDHDHDHHHDHHHHDHDHSHDHNHSHGHSHDHSHGATIQLEQEVLAKNNLLAERNRGWFSGRNIVALNLVSSPGSGKTTLLERTIKDLNGDIEINVIEGDQETVNDAERIKSTGCKVVQINTGTGCHLEADMLERGIQQLAPPMNSIVMIENVGNLVCPALFDLGEQCKIAILSVTEGEDKPSKYPHMFQASNIMILNKVDLLPHLNFDVEKCIEHARSVNPNIKIFQLSATSGEGLDEWYDWLRTNLKTNIEEQASA
ncbi:MAG: hydrogenase nickel incorporation protein HypB [Gammaproteobacteria bacterium]